MTASESAAASKPPCEHEAGRLTLRRDGGDLDDAGAPEGKETAKKEEEVTHKLAARMHEALMAWSAAPAGCKGEVVFEGAAHCGKVRG